MQSVKRFAENMGLGYEQIGDFHVPHSDAKSPGGPLFASARTLSPGSQDATRPTGRLSPLNLTPQAFNPRLWSTMHVRRTALTPAQPTAGLQVAAPSVKTHTLGLAMTYGAPMAIVARPIGWFQVKYTEVSSASERCDAALRRARTGLAKYADDPARLRDILRAFREAKAQFRAAHDVVVFRDMKDILQQAWQSAQCRCSHEERLAIHRAETDSLIRDLSERIDSLHEHILRQGQSLEAADAEIVRLRSVVTQARSIDAADLQAPPSPGVGPSVAAMGKDEAAHALAMQPAYLALRASLRDEILEAFRQEFFLAEANKTPRFAQRPKQSVAKSKDNIEQRFSQMRQASEQPLGAAHGPHDAASCMTGSFELL